MVERQLVKLTDKGDISDNSDVKDSIADIMRSIRSGSQLVRKFSGRGFLVKMRLSSSDEAKFKLVDVSISRSMQTISFSVSISIISHPPSTYAPENKELQKGVIAAAELTIEERNAPDAMQNALAKLSCTEQGKQKLREVVAMQGKGMEKHLLNKIDGIHEQLGQIMNRMDNVEQQVELVKATLAILTDAAFGQTVALGLGEFMSRWWMQACTFKRADKGSVLALDWVWFKKELHKDDLILRGLAEADGEIQVLREVEIRLLKIKTAKIKTAETDAVQIEKEVRAKKLILESTSSFHLLDDILHPLVLYSNDTNTITQSSLLRMMVIVDEWCSQKDENVRSAKDWPSFLALLFRVCPKPMLLKASSEDSFVLPTSSPSQAMLSKLMSNRPSEDFMANFDLDSDPKNLVQSTMAIIDSYHISDVLVDYVTGTRQWLFNELMSWMKSEPPQQSVSVNQTGRHRMFVLIAGPGMGKSVFSAVVQTKLTAQAYDEEVDNKKVILVSHFFKAGQLRAQGMSMIQSLALQLAERLRSDVMSQGVGGAFKSLALFQAAKKKEEELKKTGGLVEGAPVSGEEELENADGLKVEVTLDEGQEEELRKHKEEELRKHEADLALGLDQLEKAFNM